MLDLDDFIFLSVCADMDEREREDNEKNYWDSEDDDDSEDDPDY